MHLVGHLANKTFAYQCLRIKKKKTLSGHVKLRQTEILRYNGKPPPCYGDYIDILYVICQPNFDNDMFLDLVQVLLPRKTLSSSTHMPLSHLAFGLESNMIRYIANILQFCAI